MTAVGWGVVENHVLKSVILLQVAVDEAEIILLATKKEERKKGHATKLIASMVTEARRKNITRIFLEVAKLNKAAVDLYKKVGFHIIGERPGYYASKNNADAYMMALSI